MTPEEHLAAASGAINALRYAATRGDEKAVAALVNIGNRAAGHLNTLAHHPEGSAGRLAADSVAAKSWGWPVVMDAIREARKPFIPSNLGAELPIRTDNKRARNFDYRTRTGFSLSVLQDMNSDELPPLSPDNLKTWIEAALDHLGEDCGGDFAGFPWPDSLIEDAEVRSSGDAQAQEKQQAFRSECRAWLTYGFGQLAKVASE